MPQVFLQDIKKSFEGAHWDAKNLLKFTCLTMKFHSCHYTTLYSWLCFRKGYFSCIFPTQASPTASNIILPLSLPANCSFYSSMHLRGCSWGCLLKKRNEAIWFSYFFIHISLPTSYFLYNFLIVHLLYAPIMNIISMLFI